jgi:DNA-binding MarR family transcriptional regulator
MSQHDIIKPKDVLSQTDYETLAAFRHALRRFASFSSEAAKEAGLTTQQHQALLAIKGAPAETSVTVGRLAEDLMLAPHTAAELVMRLEAANLVAKRTHPADRRRTVLTLTPQAEEKLRALTLVHRREVRLLAPRLLALFRDLET